MGDNVVHAGLELYFAVQKMRPRRCLASDAVVPVSESEIVWTLTVRFIILTVKHRDWGGLTPYRAKFGVVPRGAEIQNSAS